MRHLFVSVTAILALAVTASAHAASPGSGSVTLDTPLTWTGHVNEPTGVIEEAAFAQQSTKGLCNAPACDTFSLSVPDGVGSLYIDVKGGSGARSVGFELIDPNGVATCVDDGQEVPTRSSDSENPRAGVWTVQVLGTGDFSYTATAHLARDAGGTVPSTVPSLTSKATSAKAVNKNHRFAVSVSSAAQLSDVKLTLSTVQHPHTVLASLTRATLLGSKTLTLKPAHALKRGRYVLTLTGVSDAGSPVSVKRKLTLTS